MAANDPTPRAIDGGARYLARATVAGWDAALERLAAMLAAAPQGTYSARVVAQRDPTRGQRVHLKIIYQRHDAPREDADAARQAEREARERARA